MFAALDVALAALADLDEVMIVGGAALYAEALPKACLLYLTEVDAAPQGDVHFPAFDLNEWREVACEAHGADAHNEHAYRFRVLERLNRTAPPSST